MRVLLVSTTELDCYFSLIMYFIIFQVTSSTMDNAVGSDFSFSSNDENDDDVVTIDEVCI